MKKNESSLKQHLEGHKYLLPLAALALLVIAGTAFFQQQVVKSSQEKLSFPAMELEVPLGGLDDIDVGSVDFGDLDVFSGDSFSMDGLGSDALAGLPTAKSAGLPSASASPGKASPSPSVCSNFKDVPSCSYVPQQYRQYCRQCYPDK
ncbi:MAG: hypothetical protein V1708_05075 [Candidatus Micrarchaeota archaeon]